MNTPVYATKATVIAYIRDTFSVDPDIPWSDGSDIPVFRRPDNRKWFAIIMTVSGDKAGLSGSAPVDMMNLKCDALTGAFLREPGFCPAYHMNKARWLGVRLDGTVPLSELEPLLHISYDLASGRKKPRRAPAITEE